MISNKRKHRRRSLSRLATLRGTDGRVIATCTMSDISDGGAKVILDRSVQLPESFSLWLRNNGSVYRECTVVWRTEDTLGVQFSRAADARNTSYLQPGVRFTG
jgi:hypothetical protein